MGTRSHETPLRAGEAGASLKSVPKLELGNEAMNEGDWTGPQGPVLPSDAPRSPAAQGGWGLAEMWVKLRGLSPWSERLVS